MKFGLFINDFPEVSLPFGARKEARTRYAQPGHWNAPYRNAPSRASCGAPSGQSVVKVAVSGLPGSHANSRADFYAPLLFHLQPNFTYCFTYYLRTIAVHVNNFP